MSDVMIATEAQLRRVVSLDMNAVKAVEDAFRVLSTGGVVMPPILSMAMHEKNGEVDVKTAYVPGFDRFAVKISPGFFDNPLRGLASTNGMMVLLSADTGLVEAVFLDNGYLTDIRTAAAGALAAQYLSRADSRHAAIIGTGLQAKLQLQALRLVRPIEAVTVWGRDLAKAEDFAAQCQSEGLTVKAESDMKQAVRNADIIVTTTPAQTPLLDASMLKPGQHLTAMGSDQDTKNEIHPDVFQIADYVPDRLSQTRILGELRVAIAHDFVEKDKVFPELGDIIAGKEKGRTSDAQITFADLTGTGAQDTAIANYAIGLMSSQAGTVIKT